jgi:chemotaxis family two-component system response regulator Rcp1
MQPIQILLVEDDPGDVDLVMEYLEESGVRLDIQVVENGAKAIAYLRHEGQYAHARCPDLILLDLNLPCKGGHAVLRDIKSDATLAHIPVVILTSSDDEQDVLRSYELGAKYYVTKPLGLAQFAQIVNSVESLGFMVVKLDAGE